MQVTAKKASARVASALAASVEVCRFKTPEMLVAQEYTTGVASGRRKYNWLGQTPVLTFEGSLSLCLFNNVTMPSWCLQRYI